ncbi:glycosyltransferase family 2 protein [Cupriavidus basilensis]
MRVDKMAPLKIGVPVYNGAQFVADALQSLVDQSFGDWEMLIADNASNDGTSEICRAFAAKDARIKYVCHASNLGPVANFKHVLDWADSQYFMWAAADDVWGKGFLESCIGRLEKDRRLGMAFTGLEVIDSFGQKIRECPDIPEFTGGANSTTIAKYVWSPEFHGKANLIYSVFRTEICKQAYLRFPFENTWGGDMCFNLAALSMGESMSFRRLFSLSGIRALRIGGICRPGSLCRNGCSTGLAR